MTAMSSISNLGNPRSVKMKLFEVEYEKFDYIFKKDIVHGFDYIEAFDEADAKSRAIFKHGDGLDILSVVVDV